MESFLVSGLIIDVGPPALHGALPFYSCSSQSGGATPDQVRRSIQSALAVYSSGKFSVRGNEIIMVDSSLHDGRIADGQIFDPYGTLHGCSMFIAMTTDSVNPKSALGVFKNNTIAWMSDTLSSQYKDGRFFATTDLNNDSTVEILAAWAYGGFNQFEDMWIYSWNGSQGTCINAQEEGRRSQISGLTHSFRLIDV